MAKNLQSLKPDTVLKNYWNDKEQFADFFNAVLFAGKQVIRPEELQDMDVEESSVLEHRDFAESIQAFRDNMKVRKKSLTYGIELVLLGMEHHVDKTVIMTVAGATNCKIDYNALAGKGGVDMCTLFDEIAKEGETKGRAAEIVETGYEFHLSEEDILERLQKKLNIPLQIAQEYLRTFGRQTV